MPNMKNLLQRILSAESTAAENKEKGKMVIYARAYALLADGTYVYGDVAQVSLQQLVMAIDGNWDNLTDAQKESVSAMYSAFEQTMSVWNIPNIKG